MKTLWFTLYSAGNKLDDKLGAYSSKIVGAFYFAAIALTVGGSALILHLIAYGSTLDVYVQTHIDTVLIVTVAAFGVYMLGRGLWDAFWNTGSDHK